MSFPIDVSQYKPVAIDPAQGTMTPEQKEQLLKNIQIVRDTIVFYTAVADARGYGGHTGGAYDITPEVLIADSFMNASDRFYPVFFDEAGHRVAIQYAMAAFKGDMPFEKLLHYRAPEEGLYGHPEIDPKLGVKFASGRLGHMWPFVNGIALAHPDKVVFMFGSDGSQQEGDDAEAARMAVARGLNVKLVIDDNNVTIAGHPKEYLPGYDVAKTLNGHGLTVSDCNGEDFTQLFAQMLNAVNTDGPVAVVNRRPMMPGIKGMEGSCAGHDVIKASVAIEYLEARGHQEAADYIKNVEKIGKPGPLKGSTDETCSNRSEFGNIVSDIIDKIPAEERAARLAVIDSDLEGSTGLKNISKNHPDLCFNGGIMERGNFSAAAGFGFTKGKQAIFSTFGAFLEMIISEATMARLNEANVICHFSHSSIDQMADNTCHYGVNVMLADCGLGQDDNTRLYFPADANQLRGIMNAIWDDEGLRFVFTTRGVVPFVCKEDGSKVYGDDYTFTPGKDEVIREGSAGYVVSYGDILCRALDAVDRARAEGIDVGLINKPTLNVVDEETMRKIGKTGFVLVAENQNVKTGVGSRFGTWLLERGFTPKFSVSAVADLGEGGIHEHIPHHKLDGDSLLAKIKSLA